MHLANRGDATALCVTLRSARHGFRRALQLRSSNVALHVEGGEAANAERRIVRLLRAKGILFVKQERQATRARLRRGSSTDTSGPFPTTRCS